MRRTPSQASATEPNDNEDEETAKEYKERKKTANLLRCQIVAQTETAGADDKPSPKVNQEK